MRVHPGPGDYETAVEEPQVQVWVEKLIDCLSKPQAELSAGTKLHAPIQYNFPLAKQSEVYEFLKAGRVEQ